MRRRSDRGKTKPAEKEESPEKSTRKSHRHSRRRRKSSSSSDGTSINSKKDVENISQPLEVQVQDIELPQGENPASAIINSESETKESENVQNEWKEDNSFWESEVPKGIEQQPSAEGSATEKEESSLWKVQSANGAGGGGEIQKLKICRQRPTESPELGEASLRKRLGRIPRESRSTDDSTHEESEKDTKKSKHRTRTSSRNSPLVSPTVVCDMSEDSPTKIKIISVSHINTDNKEANITTANEVTSTDGDQELKTNQTQDENQINNDTLDIALPTDGPPLQKLPELDIEEIGEKKIEETSISGPNNEVSEIEVEESSKVDSKMSESSKEEDSLKKSPKISPLASPRPYKDDIKSPSSRSTSRGSDSSEEKSGARKVKKKRRRDLKSTVQRKLSTSASPQHQSSDSEDDAQKKEADQEESTEAQVVNKDIVNDKENEADNSLSTKENNIEETNGMEEHIHKPMPRKRRWGSRKANRLDKKPILNISTDSLKSLIPDAKPVPAEELQLSMEEEEGQLDDDEEDEVVALVVKEEEKQLERERQREERQKEKEKELEERKKRQERLEKNKPEQPPRQDTSNKGAVSRKILLLTDDAKKLARSPSPPRHKSTSVLYITHLVRPFTIQQLRNLLLRTGTIAENGFWIDKIKSKCYVEYTTEDAAVETRHALHGVRWPTSNPKTLLVEFASRDDLILAQTLTEEPEVPRKSEPLTMVEGWVADQARIKERTRRAAVREWDVGKPEHPDEVFEYDLKLREKREQDRKARKERPHRSATPETEPPARKSRRKEEDPPARLLDDLFRKTKTSPCIYWLPLTQEQITVKEEIRRQHMAEHERRMAELKKVELARRERERRNRK